jgi:hypothetical protein
VALSSNPHERKVAKTAILLERPIQDNNPHKRCGIQNPEESKVEDDGGTPGPTRNLSGCRSKRVHLRSERRVAFGVQPPPKERKIVRDSQEHIESTALRRKERWYTVSLFGTNSLKEGAMLQAD